MPICKHLPHARPRITDLYRELIEELINQKSNQVIVDVGGGSRCFYARRRRAMSKTRLIAVDISPTQLASNSDVDQAVASDVCSALPFASESIDVITSCFVVEHLKDVNGFLNACAYVLKPGGVAIHLFPSRYAIFAVFNSILPHRWSLAVLKKLLGSEDGHSGFRAYYNACSRREFSRICESHGMIVKDVRFGYCQSYYFTFFVPMFAAVAALECLMYALNIETYFPYLLVITEKPASQPLHTRNFSSLEKKAG